MVNPATTMRAIISVGVNLQQFGYNDDGLFAKTGIHEKRQRLKTMLQRFVGSTLIDFL
jgi:hypothetical protein